MTEQGDGQEVVVGRPRPGIAVVRLAATPLGVLRASVREELRAALSQLDADPTMRVIVLTGTGRAFSAGADIREFQLDRSWLARTEDDERALFGQVEASRLPVLAACNGLALGGGALLALCCDIRIAARSASFGFPEVTVGAMASAGATQRLPRILGRGRALDLLLTGRTVDATEALAIGLVEHVTEDDRLIADTLDIAERIASMPGEAIQATKRAVLVGLLDGAAAGAKAERRLALRLGLSTTAAEGRLAFLEKRPRRCS